MTLKKLMKPLLVATVFTTSAVGAATLVSCNNQTIDKITDSIKDIVKNEQIKGVIDSVIGGGTTESEKTPVVTAPTNPTPTTPSKPTISPETKEPAPVVKKEQTKSSIFEDQTIKSIYNFELEPDAFFADKQKYENMSSWKSNDWQKYTKSFEVSFNHSTKNRYGKSEIVKKGTSEFEEFFNKYSIKNSRKDQNFSVFSTTGRNSFTVNLEVHNFLEENVLNYILNNKTKTKTKDMKFYSPSYFKKFSEANNDGFFRSSEIVKKMVDFTDNFEAEKHYFLNFIENENPHSDFVLNYNITGIDNKKGTMEVNFNLHYGYDDSWHYISDLKNEKFDGMIKNQEVLITEIQKKDNITPVSSEQFKSFLERNIKDRHKSNIQNFLPIEKKIENDSNTKRIVVYNTERDSFDSNTYSKESGFEIIKKNLKHFEFFKSSINNTNKKGFFENFNHLQGTYADRIGIESIALSIPNNSLATLSKTVDKSTEDYYTYTGKFNVEITFFGDSQPEVIKDIPYICLLQFSNQVSKY